MTITIRLFGELRQHLPPEHAGKRSTIMEVPDGLTAQQLILRLGIPYGVDEGQIVVAVNDVEVEHGHTLQPGDTVSLFEPLAGG